MSIQVSKMVTRMVRHYDEDERQSDASMHWDTIRPVLLKALTLGKINRRFFLPDLVPFA